MEFSLQMVFVCANGEKSSMTISEVKSGLTQANIVTLMDNIIANDIFVTDNGALTAKYSAQIVQREVTKYELK